MVLVGTGWSYMTPFLRDREKRILMVVIPLQVRLPCNGHCTRPDNLAGSHSDTAH